MLYAISRFLGKDSLVDPFPTRILRGDFKIFSSEFTLNHTAFQKFLVFGVAWKLPRLVDRKSVHIKWILAKKFPKIVEEVQREQIDKFKVKF